MIDVDFFKLYNDAYGHQLGDDCLTRIARALRIGLNRAGDFIGRYGGEEFVAILPNVDTEAAREHGKRLCEYVRELAIPHSGSVVAGDRHGKHRLRSHGANAGPDANHHCRRCRSGAV